MNPVALASRFVSAPGVRLSSPNAILTSGGGGDIHAERTSSEWTLTFFRGTSPFARTGLSPGILDFRVTGDRVDYVGTRNR